MTSLAVYSVVHCHKHIVVKYIIVLVVLLALPASLLRPGLSDPADRGTQSPDPMEAAIGTLNHRSCRLHQRYAGSPTRPSPLSGNLGL